MAAKKCWEQEVFYAVYFLGGKMEFPWKKNFADTYENQWSVERAIGPLGLFLTEDLWAFSAELGTFSCFKLV